MSGENESAWTDLGDTQPITLPGDGESHEHEPPLTPDPADAPSP